MPSALVTGGTGFIGSHLVPALLDRGWRVRTCGRQPRPEGLPPEVDYLQADLAGEGPFDRLLDGVTHVFHLAGLSSSWGTPEEVERSNVRGTQHVLAAAYGAGVDRFVHVSTSAVYGEKQQLPLPVTEDVEPHPNRGYGVAKRMAEEAVSRYIDKDFPAVILRPVTVYGPGNTKLLASAILDVAIERYAGIDRIEVHREPVALRLVHITDVVRACLHVAQRDGTAGEIYNVSSGEYPTSLEVAIDIATAMRAGVRLTDDPDCGLSVEERRHIRQRMIDERRMRPDILLYDQRFRFLRKSNRNNELNIEKLRATGWVPRCTDTRRGVVGFVAWCLRERWIV